MGKIFRISQEFSLMRWIFVENIDVLANHIFHFDRQKGFQRLQRFAGCRIHILNLQIEVRAHHVDRRVFHHGHDPRHFRFGLLFLDNFFRDIGGKLDHLTHLTIRVKHRVI